MAKLFSLLFATLAIGAYAAELGEIGGVDFSGSGFLTLAAGVVTNSGDPQTASGYRCPCFISDYAQAGVYQSHKLTAQPDSKLGFQGRATVNQDLSFTGQVVFRDTDRANVDLEWLYGSYQLSDWTTLQFGRKRLPLFYYSESQDVDLSYPWVHLSPQLYGWEIVNYDGANLLLQREFAGWAVNADVFAGSEKVHDDDYWKMYNGRNTRTDSKWSNIVGADISISRGGFEARLMHIESYLQSTTPPGLVFSPKAHQDINGLSFHAEYTNWIVQAEFLYLNRNELYGKDRTQLFGVGYRVGKYLPMVTVANYRQAQRYDPADGWDPTHSEAHRDIALTLRYDISPSSDFKLQFDHWKNTADPNFFAYDPTTANPRYMANLVSASYDMSF